MRKGKEKEKENELSLPYRIPNNQIGLISSFPFIFGLDRIEYTVHSMR